MSLTAAGCGDDRITNPLPEITLSVADCDTDDIGINATATQSGRSGSYRVNVSMTVMCGDRPLGRTQLRVTYWSLTIKRAETDEGGVARFAVATPVDVKGETVTITVQGADGEEKPFEFQVK